MGSLGLAIKRAVDILGALLGLVVLSPVLGLTAAAIWLTDGSPVLFRQRRAGYRERPFFILKFRSMKNAYGLDGKLLPDSQRLTSLGRFLRMTSLDELPQLWNVLVGEMSLVGPRPLYVEYLPHYTERERKRHSVRPGITGLAQVKGRNSLSWGERLAFDVQYVENWSLLLDLKILLWTVFKVIARQDVDVITAAEGSLAQSRQPRSPAS